MTVTKQRTERNPMAFEPAPWARPVTVCLVRTPTLTNISAVGQDAVPPIGLAYIASALGAAGHHVSVVDAVGDALHQYTRVEDAPHALLHGLRSDELVQRINPAAEVIGVSCMFPPKPCKGCGALGGDGCQRKRVSKLLEKVNVMPLDSGGIEFPRNRARGVGR